MNIILRRSLTGVAESPWNRWPDHRGLGGRMVAEFARPGQKRKQLIVNIEGTKAEQLIYERLKNRQSLQELLLEILGDSGELKK